MKKSSTIKNIRNLKRAKTDVSTYDEAKPIFQEYIKSSGVSAKHVFNVFQVDTGWYISNVYTASRSAGHFFNKKNQLSMNFKTLFTSWTYAETVFSIFDENISHTSISVKKSFDVPFSDVSWQISQENSSPFTGGHIHENSVEKLLNFT